ncbi:MAG: hypothetical protein NTZ34_06030 [Chloroflexi bacterium]|nr:hypothetical protein [Chloroflexota bacterium]
MAVPLCAAVRRQWRRSGDNHTVTSCEPHRAPDRRAACGGQSSVPLYKRQCRCWGRPARRVPLHPFLAAPNSRGTHDPGPFITCLGVTADVTVAAGHLPTASILPVIAWGGESKVANRFDYVRKALRRGGVGGLISAGRRATDF